MPSRGRSRLARDAALSGAVLLLGGVLWACVTGGGSTKIPSYPSALGSVTSYHLEADRVTKAGIRYAGPLDPAYLDRATLDISRCLADIREPDAEERKAMDCLGPGPINRVIDVKAFDVWLAPDWGVTKCSTEQTFPCRIDPKGCLDKGLEPTAECPCRCRATVQDGRHVVVTPDLKIYPGELVRLVTGCNMPWGQPLMRCLVPPTP